MKKSFSIRFAYFLLVFVVISACLISASFARFSSKNIASDGARVARWGIELATWNTDNANANVFSSSYDGTVSAHNSTDFLVAPGTDNDSTATISIKGNSEVAFKLDFSMNIESDVVVPANVSTNDEDYYPVIFTLTRTKRAGVTDNTVLASGNLLTIKTAFEGLSKAEVSPNTVFDDVYTLTWDYPFEDDGISYKDEADTLLGINAAGSVDNSAEGLSYKIAFDISISATQID